MKGQTNDGQLLWDSKVHSSEIIGMLSVLFPNHFPSTYRFNTLNPSHHGGNKSSVNDCS